MIFSNIKAGNDGKSRVISFARELMVGESQQGDHAKSNPEPLGNAKRLALVIALY
jgi:hypothetical protein